MFPLTYVFTLVSLLFHRSISSSLLLLSIPCLLQMNLFFPTGFSPNVISVGYGAQHLTWIPCMKMHNGYLLKQEQLTSSYTMMDLTSHKNLFIRERKMPNESLLPL